MNLEQKSFLFSKINIQLVDAKQRTEQSTDQAMQLCRTDFADSLKLSKICFY